MSISAATSTPDVIVSSTPAASSASSSTVSADTFLKLLVAQMQNQDPLNPMDNAEVTSQMAQINTVTGINTLNTTVQSLSSQFTQMQALQAASLVGHSVIVPGNTLNIDPTSATGQGGFQIATPADAVKVDILAAGGGVGVPPPARMSDVVGAVSPSGNPLNLEVQNSGTVPYTTVVALN